MTRRAVRFHGAARRELRKAVDRYDEQVVGLGDEFAAEVEHSVRLIAAHPESGSPHRLGTRRIRVRRFPYGLVYAERKMFGGLHLYTCRGGEYTQVILSPLRTEASCL